MTDSVSDDIDKVLATAAKFKKVMQKKKIRRARTKCPRCGDWLNGVLSGRKDHIHMFCTGKCGMNLME